MTIHVVVVETRIKTWLTAILGTNRLLSAKNGKADTMSWTEIWDFVLFVIVTGICLMIINDRGDENSIVLGNSGWKNTCSIWVEDV
jgi:hypothetical protein